MATTTATAKTEERNLLQKLMDADMMTKVGIALLVVVIVVALVYLIRGSMRGGGNVLQFSDTSPGPYLTNTPNLNL